VKFFIVISGSHLAAHAIAHMPMLQIVGRREGEKCDHRHCGLLRPRGGRLPHRAPNHFDEIARRMLSLATGRIWLSTQAIKASNPPGEIGFQGQVVQCRTLEQQMAATGQERTSPAYSAVSALPPKADIDHRYRHVRYVLASSTGHCNTARSLSAGVSKPKVFRGR
jgi:hypothetical protein